MQTTLIKDGAKVLGQLGTDSQGNQILLDSGGHKLGTYSESSGNTLDAAGRPIAYKGQGNQLLRLLPK